MRTRGSQSYTRKNLPTPSGPPTHLAVMVSLPPPLLSVFPLREACWHVSGLKF
ncbi:hypothetical protein K402DRAFT_88971 [Aulographum hederae CBS 113979]|uniref:Uncharacterized protein n=1 Tax=Aulographum hederae CBS 113979 TaxID=1176131 RepID=A0A6G1H057_9PEZI|nr:hypothetical protein K402DRAFT_88971 [Aulographum hederae CBS 113979]